MESESIYFQLCFVLQNQVIQVTIKKGWDSQVKRGVPSSRTFISQQCTSSLKVHVAAQCTYEELLNSKMVLVKYPFPWIRSLEFFIKPLFQNKKAKITPLDFDINSSNSQIMSTKTDTCETSYYAKTECMSLNRAGGSYDIFWC